MRNLSFNWRLILAPPAGYVLLAACVFLLVRAGRARDQKYEGLRILRG